MSKKAPPVVLVVIVGKPFDDLAVEPNRRHATHYLVRLLWWLFGTSAAAVLGYWITQLLS